MTVNGGGTSFTYKPNAKDSFQEFGRNLLRLPDIQL